MSEKHSLASFISDLDKIVSRESIIPSEREDCAQEEKELLFLAQILVKADYATESSGRIKKMISHIRENGELEDDDLDLVAGGLNLNASDIEKGKKDGL
jgi:replicative DNA helicase